MTGAIFGEPKVIKRSHYHVNVDAVNKTVSELVSEVAGELKRRCLDGGFDIYADNSGRIETHVRLMNLRLEGPELQLIYRAEILEGPSIPH